MILRNFKIFLKPQGNCDFELPQGTELGWTATDFHAWPFHVFFEVIFTNGREGHLPKTNKLISKQPLPERAS